MKRYDVLGGRLETEGTFRKLEVWVRGWHPELASPTWNASLVEGTQGEETKLQVCEVRPIRTFEVRNAE